MKTLLYKGMVLLFVLLALPLLGQEERDRIPYGKWVVAKPAYSAYEFKPPSTYTPYLGKKIVIKPGKFKTFFVRTAEEPFKLEKAVCKEPEYIVEEEERAQFLKYNALPTNYFFPDDPETVPVLYVLCPNSDGKIGGRFYLLPNGRLMLSYQGLVLHFQRKRARFLFFRF